MFHYIALNIGPIYQTLSMGRKPRELWQASYLFSHLMKCLLKAFQNNKNLEIISPNVMDSNPMQTKQEESYRQKAGIYPDRAFLKVKSSAEISQKEIDLLLQAGLTQFTTDLELENAEHIVRDYFNVMTASCRCETDREAVNQLNQWLNYLELSTHAPQPGTVEVISQMLQKTWGSPLFKLAFGKKHFDVETLEEIAKYEKTYLHDTVSKTYHNYICIVQADGDGMGRVVTHLPDGKLSGISSQLALFSQQSCQLIGKFGGMPIYAGGDDLLFIAPVWGMMKGKRQHIFQLLDNLDVAYTNTVGEAVKEQKLHDQNGNIETSITFGLSITYVKFPLYEAWKYASNQLFGKAKKNWKKKHAIAWRLQKHSGSTFEASLTRLDTDLYEAFKALLEIPAKELIVSAVAHKLRSAEGMLDLMRKSDVDLDIRLEAFFTKVIDIEDKSQTDQEYLEKVKQLLKTLFIAVPKMQKLEPDKITSHIVSMAYSMLRTAKFINGEEEKQ